MACWIAWESKIGSWPSGIHQPAGDASLARTLVVGASRTVEFVPEAMVPDLKVANNSAFVGGQSNWTTARVDIANICSTHKETFYGVGTMIALELSNSKESGNLGNYPAEIKGRRSASAMDLESMPYPVCGEKPNA
jgi:hypothetical protein